MSTVAPPSPLDAPARRVPWRSVAVFMAVAYAGMALLALPFWFLEGGIRHPLYVPVIALAMFTPTLGSVVAIKVVERGSWVRGAGLRFRGRGRRLTGWSLLGLVIVLAINIASVVVMVLRGVPGDLTGRTWLDEATRQFAAQGQVLPPAAVIGVVLVSSLVGLVTTAVPALGEEIGWRGFLWQRLKPLGFTGAVTVGGVIWSLWHLPIVLIGHNYPGMPRPFAIGMFLVACVSMNFLFGAITERSAGNPLPAAVAHSTLNSLLGVCLSLAATRETAAAINWYLDLPTGLAGIVLFTVAGYLVMPKGARATFGRHAVSAAPAPVAEAGVRADAAPGVRADAAPGQAQWVGDRHVEPSRPTAP